LLITTFGRFIVTVKSREGLLNAH